MLGWKQGAGINRNDLSKLKESGFLTVRISLFPDGADACNFVGWPRTCPPLSQLFSIYLCPRMTCTSW